jgi:hypothetical protein
LLVFGIGGSTLLSVQKMSIFADRSTRAELFQTSYARHIQRVIDPGEDIDFRSVPTDRSFNPERFSLQGRIFKSAHGQMDGKRLFRRTSLVRDPVDLEPEFQNS